MLEKEFLAEQSRLSMKSFQECESVSAQVDRITIQLQKHQTHLTRDIELLDTLVLYKNKQYFDDLSLHIIAAQQKKLQLENEKLPQLHKPQLTKIKWIFNKLQICSNLYIDQIKRIYDLQLSRTRAFL